MGCRTWEHYAGVFILAALATTAGCDNDNPVDAVHDPQLTYTLEECDPASRVLTRLAAFPEVAITVSGNSVRFQHALETYCNAVGDSALTVTTTVLDSDIVVTEWFEGRAVRCTCRFPISGQIDGLAPGTYRIWFIHSIRLEDVPAGDQPESQVLHQGSVTIAAN